MSDIGVDWQERIDWNALRRGRLDRLQAALDGSGVDALLVQRYENMKYLTSVRPFVSMIYAPRYAAFFSRRQGVTLLTERGDYELHTREMPWLPDIRDWPYGIEDCVSTVLGTFDDHGLGEDAVIGYDDALSPTLVSMVHKSRPTITWIDATEIIARAKMLKSSEEIKAIRAAAEIADIGMYAVLDNIRPGMKECEVAGVASKAMLDAGCDMLASHPQVSSDPMRRMASDRRIRDGDVVLVDLNPGFNGYLGDIARTIAIGRPSAEQRRNYQVQNACLAAALSRTRAGTAVADIQGAVESIVVEAGLKEHWHGYITGHGVGTGSGPLEQPVIGTHLGFAETLEAGMVIAFEPGIFQEGVGPIRVEELVAVGDDGYELLTHSPHDEKLRV